MIALTPKEGVGGEKITHLMAPIIENERAPILVCAFARILMLVERGAIEPGQGPGVAGEMRGHPIHEHPDAGLVERIHEKLKIVRSPIATRGRVTASNLIAPGRIKT